MNQRPIKKRIVCGAAALLMTSLTLSVFQAEAEPKAKPAATQEIQPNQTVIARGRYIAQIAGCNDCHTAGYALSGGAVDESQWLMGDSLGWQGDWGTTYPINLRLYVNGLTPEQWLVVARKEMCPPMPWFALRDMSDADLLAFYHFVKTLGPAGEPAPAYVPPGGTANTPVIKFPGSPQ